MKYFTPERLVRLQDRSDEDSFLAALNDWEQALEQYQKRLEQIRLQLPGSLRRLLASVPLHDAHVLAISLGQRNRLTMTLYPEAEPSRLVVLGYSLVESPQMDTVLSPDVCSEPVSWLYDELDIVPAGRRKVKGAAGPLFLHNILLSNGAEVRLRFQKVTVTRPTPLLPAGSPGCEVMAPTARSA